MQDPADKVSNIDASVLGATEVGANLALCGLRCRLVTGRAPPEASSP